MRSKLLNEAAGSKTYAIVFDEGDEVMSGLEAFAKEEQIDAAQFTALGAFQQATLAFFNVQTNEYDKIPVSEQVEVLVLTGNVATHQEKGEPKIHAHVVLGKADGVAFGGHVLEAHVRPTLEVVLVETLAHLKRQIDDKTGLALIRLSA
jgi:predicted DNA-binding protein with PD1-like motif